MEKGGNRNVREEEKKEQRKEERSQVETIPSQDCLQRFAPSSHDSSKPFRRQSREGDDIIIPIHLSLLYLQKTQIPLSILP